jgi:hypothetical protein
MRIGGKLRGGGPIFETGMSAPWLASGPDVGSAPASYTGQVAFRALIPRESQLEHLSTQGASMYIGPNRMFLHYPLRKNTLMNVVAISRQPRWEQEGWAISAKVGELLELYQDFPSLSFGDDWSYPA